MNEFSSAAMHEAYLAALEQVKQESEAPEHIREARRRALLRWLPEGWSEK